MIFLRPIMLATLKPERLEAIMEKHKGEVLEYPNYTAETKSQLYKIWNKIPNKNKDIILKYDILNSGRPRFIGNILSMGGTIKDWKMDSVTTNCVLKGLMLASERLSSSLLHGVIKEYITHMNITDAKLVNKLLSTLKPTQIGDILKSIDPQLISFEFIKEIAMSNHKSILLSIDNIPVKIQRMLIRKSPYNIQYINNPDQSVINELRKKYGNDIDEYILGVL